MSEAMFAVLCFGLSLLLIFWWMYAAGIECIERFELLYATAGDDVLVAEYKSVSANKHFIFILLFRNRRPLYPKIYAAMEGNDG